MAKHTVFIDMDGTLAEWKPLVLNEEESLKDAIDRVLYSKDYYYNLEPNRTALSIARQLLKNPDVEVFVLSCVLPDKEMSGYTATPQKDKLKWLSKYLPINRKNIIFVPDGNNKAEYVKQNIMPLNEDTILIDDYKVNLKQWVDAGGYAYKYFNGINSLSYESVAHGVIGSGLEVKNNNFLCKLGFAKKDDGLLKKAVDTGLKMVQKMNDAGFYDNSGDRIREIRHFLALNLPYILHNSTRYDVEFGYNGPTDLHITVDGDDGRSCDTSLTFDFIKQVLPAEFEKMYPDYGQMKGQMSIDDMEL